MWIQEKRVLSPGGTFATCPALSIGRPIYTPGADSIFEKVCLDSGLRCAVLRVGVWSSV